MTRSVKWSIPLLLAVVLVGSLCLLRSGRNGGKTVAPPPQTRVVRMGGRPAGGVSARLGARNGSKPQAAARRSTETSASRFNTLVVVGLATGKDGVPVKDVSVWLTDSDAGTTQGVAHLVAESKTDAEGLYRLGTNEVPRQAVVNASKSGFASTAVVIQPRQLDATTRQMQAITVNLSLLPAAPIKGKVADKSGTALTGVAISVSSKANAVADGLPAGTIQTWSTSTAPDGTFSLDDVPADTLTVEAAKAGFTTQTAVVRAPADHLDFALDWRGADIDGCVYHLAGGSGASGATVRLTQTAWPGEAIARPRVWTAVCDNLGVFRFAGLPDGAYDLAAEKDGLRLAPRDTLLGNRVEISAAAPATGLQLFLYDGHTLSGVVTEEGTTAPVEGVQVTALCRPPVSTVTGSDGTYLLAGIASESAGNYVPVQLAKKGWVMYGQDDGDTVQPDLVRLDPRQPRQTRRFEMQRIVHIEGRVVNEAGLGVAGAAVTCDRETMESPADGSFHFASSRIGHSVELLVRAAGYGRTGYECDDLDGQSTSGITIVLHPAASVEGMVLDPDGKPLPEATVDIMYEKVQTDADGRFLVGALPGGELQLVASKDGYARSERAKLQLTSGETRSVVLRMRQSHHLAGVVVDDGGKPVTQANIGVWNQTSTEWFAGGPPDNNGHFRFAGIGADRATIAVHARMDYEKIHKFVVDTNRDDLRVVLPRRQQVILAAKVLDARTSQPVSVFQTEQLPVLVDGSNDLYQVDVVTQPAGAFTAKLASGLSYRFVIKAPGYAPFDTGDFKVPGGKPSIEVTCSLQPQGQQQNQTFPP